jgi:hypothetical protein
MNTPQKPGFTVVLGGAVEVTIGYKLIVVKCIHLVHWNCTTPGIKKLSSIH